MKDLAEADGNVCYEDIYNKFQHKKIQMIDFDLFNKQTNALLGDLGTSVVLNITELIIHLNLHPKKSIEWN